MFFVGRLHRPILITGHPRCGTTSAAALCRKIDLQVGDEWVGPHGISSWMMAVDDRRNPYSLDEFARSRRNLSWDWLFLVVRDIKDAVPSVIVENDHAPPSYAFRRKHIKKRMGIDLDNSKDPISKAILSIVCWTRIILDQSPDLVFHIEDQQDVMRDFLVKNEIANKDYSNITVNEKENSDKYYGQSRYSKPNLTKDDWTDLYPTVKEGLNWYCKQFGYRDPAE